MNPSTNEERMAEQCADPNVFNMDYFRLDGKVALVTGGILAYIGKQSQ